jgi:hypothetical protein
MGDLQLNHADPPPFAFWLTVSLSFVATPSSSLCCPAIGVQVCTSPRYVCAASSLSSRPSM